MAEDRAEVVGPLVARPALEHPELTGVVEADVERAVAALRQPGECPRATGPDRAVAGVDRADDVAGEERLPRVASLDAVRPLLVGEAARSIRTASPGSAAAARAARQVRPRRRPRARLRETLLAGPGRRAGGRAPGSDGVGAWRIPAGGRRRRAGVGRRAPRSRCRSGSRCLGRGRTPDRRGPRTRGTASSCRDSGRGREGPRRRTSPTQGLRATRGRARQVEVRARLVCNPTHLTDS